MSAQLKLIQILGKKTEKQEICIKIHIFDQISVDQHLSIASKLDLALIMTN